MKILNVEFESIRAEKNWPRGDSYPKGGGVSFRSSLERVRTIEEKVREADFACQVGYDPNIAHMRFEGRVVFKAESSVVKKVEMEKGDHYDALMGAVTGHITVQATKASETLNIPPPFPVGGESKAVERERGREYA